MVSIFFHRRALSFLVIVWLGFSVQPVHGQIQPGPGSTAPGAPPISPMPPTRVPPQKIDNNKIDNNKLDEIFRNWPKIEEQNDTNVAPYVRDRPTAKKSADSFSKFAQAAFIVVLIVGGLTGLWLAARPFIGLRVSRDPQQLALNDPSVRAYLKQTEAVKQPVTGTTERR